MTSSDAETDSKLIIMLCYTTFHINAITNRMPAANIVSSSSVYTALITHQYVAQMGWKKFHLHSLFHFIAHSTFTVQLLDDQMAQFSDR